MPPRGDPRALALGPGYLHVNLDLTAPEPVDLTTEWDVVDPGWVLLGYTETGSEFNYALATGEVLVAEELDPVLTSTTGRTGTVAFTLAEMTASNLAFALNGGEFTLPGGDIVIVEPPDLGDEKRVMIGFESEDHTERWVYRKCFQTGTMKIIRQKGTTIAGIATTFTLEKPTTGKRLYAAIFRRSLRAGWNPDAGGALPTPPTLTSLAPAGGAQAGGTAVTANGTFLTGATQVNFGTAVITAANITPGGNPDTSLVVNSPTAALAGAPGGGPVDVTVTTPDGVSGAQVFTYA